MPRLFWLVFDHGDETTLFIQPAESVVYARLRDAIAGMDSGSREGYEMVRKVPMKLIGNPRKLTIPDY